MNDRNSDSKSHKSTIIKYWMEKSFESIEAAHSEYRAGRLTPAVRNTYYSCFYALAAVLLKKGKTFKKHTAVRAALHRDLIKSGLLDASWGRFYNTIFDSRHEGDYEPLVRFEKDQVKEFIKQAEEFIKQMENLLARRGKQDGTQ